MEKRPAHRPTIEGVTTQQQRFVQFMAYHNMTNKQMADALGVHTNTIMNWKKDPRVKEAIQQEVEFMREKNMLKVNKLLDTLIVEATKIVGSESTPMSQKVQLIGQLMSQAGKLSGMEQPKKVEKKVQVEQRSFEKLIEAEIIDVE